jgi:hypothetical protein
LDTARRWVVPELIDQTLGRDDVVLVEQQVGEQRALPRASDGESLAPCEYLDRSEDPKVHPALLESTLIPLHEGKVSISAAD